MSALLALLWFFGTLAAIFFVVRPQPEWPIVSTRSRSFWLLIAIFVGLPTVAAIFGINASSLKPTQDASPQKTSTTEAGAVAPVAPGPSTAGNPPPSNWTYSDDVDQMRGTKTHFASISSETELQFGFPYDGGKATLTIRQRPTDGLNIFLQIKAQFLCSQFNNETVAAKFDNLPIENYSCSEPSDGSTGFLFVRGASRFVSHLKKAKTLTLEAPFYQYGRRQMAFDVRGLVWK